MRSVRPQVFLRGHDSNITCLSLSKTGKYIASGQYGENSDAIVWDYATKSLLYRMSEHDHGIECVAFSDDELLLCTVGAVDDNKILIWDLSNGYIVTMMQHDPSPTTCVSWGGMVKDIKRRNTANYQLCTGGSQRLVLWSVNPFTGETVSCSSHLQPRLLETRPRSGGIGRGWIRHFLSGGRAAWRRRRAIVSDERFSIVAARASSELPHHFPPPTTSSC